MQISLHRDNKVDCIVLYCIVVYCNAQLIKKAYSRYYSSFSSPSFILFFILILKSLYSVILD